MKIRPTTTLGDLEVVLRSHGLSLFAKLEPDGRYFCLLGDAAEKHTINGSAYGSTLCEAIDSALMEYAQSKYGPRTTKEQRS